MRIDPYIHACAIVSVLPPLQEENPYYSPDDGDYYLLVPEVCCSNVDEIADSSTDVSRVGEEIQLIVIVGSSGAASHCRITGCVTMANRHTGEKIQCPS